MLQNCGKSGKNTEILPFYKQKCRGRIISQQRVHQLGGTSEVTPNEGVACIPRKSLKLTTR